MRKTALEFYNSHSFHLLSSDELYSECVIAFNDCVRSFDVDRHYSFRAYLQRSMTNMMVRAREAMKKLYFPGNNTPVSLDSTYKDDDTRCLHEMIGEEDKKSEEILTIDHIKLIINRKRTGLTEKERKALQLLLSKHTKKDIAEMIGSSLSNTYRIIDNATVKIRKELKKKS